MPTVNVDKEIFYEILGKQYSTDEFRELCFDFGIELEEDTSVKEMAAKMGGAKEAEDLSERALLKIDIPANRYDLLCTEGLSRALLIFQNKIKPPTYKLVAPKDGKLQKILVRPETSQIRPYVVGAVLRDITFTEDNYNNFIDLQDKLHNNICRKRTLVAIGTHDLDTVEGPFTYEALAPKEIQFTPLNQTQNMNGEQLMTFYEKDKHLSKFLPIIRDSPVYPVIYDSKRTVLSLPPIINGDHSKIKLTTKNVFIECTGTDLTKAKIVLNTMVTMFSQYCGEKWSIEPVEVEYPDGKTFTYPDLSSRTVKTDSDYINSMVGIKLTPEEVAAHLNRMSLNATVTDKEAKEISVEIPPTRSDILHPCDIMEDVAIAYGFNNIPKTFPKTTTIGSALPVNKLSDLLRREFALSGFTEVLPLILCSHDENFAYLNKEDDGKTAVKLANPKTVEYQVVRNALLTGILKTVCSNKKQPLPIKIFEVSDVVFKDDTQERRARNERHACALYCNKTDSFETIHGLLDRVMQMLNVKLVAPSSKSAGYYIAESGNPTFFPGRSADIYYRPAKGEASVIGAFGVLHPEVLGKFEIPFPCSALEFSVEPFL
ncbi:phenylalanine--tRNA ligase subunit beta [Basidiobolus ranarum]|uniref:phenylalanine--tRNA ligase n=1 Tax=Basidiobolus ranarum TaxID=34480 RepID=A0ABR2WMF1_9FUNG